MFRRIDGHTSWIVTIFTLVVLASALGNLSQTGVNAMLMFICVDFGITEALGQCLTTSYMLVIGIAVPLCSWMMGRFNLKSLAMACFGGFSLGALVSACAPSFALLLAGRLLQAVTAGILLPLQTNIIMSRFPEGRKATAMGISGIAMGFAPNIGPTIGGAMADALGWRSFFIFLVAADLAILLFCWLFVAKRPDRSFPVAMDGVSLILAALGFGGVLMGASNASSAGFVSLAVWVPAVVGAICIGLFVMRQKKLENPLVGMGIFSNRTFVYGFVALCLLYASFMSVTLIIPLYVQNLCGGSATQAGMVLLPATIVALVANPAAGIMADKVGIRPVVLVCGLFLTVGALLAATCNETTPIWLAALYQAIRGVGISGLIGPLTAWSLGELEGRQIADGSAFGIMSRQACASIGTALMVTCATGAAGFTGAWAFHAAFGLSFLFALALLILVMAKCAR